MRIIAVTDIYRPEHMRANDGEDAVIFVATHQLARLAQMIGIEHGTRALNQGRHRHFRSVLKEFLSYER